MQFNYYTLKRLSDELSALLKNSIWVESFSQQKDELIIVLERAENAPFYIRCTLSNTLHTLSFPKEFHKSRKNVVSLFTALNGKKLLKVRQYENERAFSFEFDSGDILLFKLFGNRSNLMLYQNDEKVTLFKKNLFNDYDLSLKELDRPITRNFQLFEANPDPNHFYPTFGPVLKQKLKELGYERAGLEQKWTMLTELVEAIEESPFILLKTPRKPVLSLVTLENIENQELGTNAISALNTFYKYYTGEFFLRQEKDKAKSILNRKLKQCSNYSSKTKTKLEALKKETSPAQLADLIMANLHNIDIGSGSVKLLNFYTGEEVTIKLKKALSPQKNAELLYRKSKNRTIEINTLQKNLDTKSKEVEVLKTKIEEIDKVGSFKELRSLYKNELSKTHRSDREILPFKEFQIQGYKIWVGKNAKSNDVLTLKHTYKEDTWLHVKDIPGSHVLIKHQAGHKTPRFIIEQAASIAAYYSKRKTDSHVPVIYTPAKYVRKRKGSPPGQVVVEREQVILVNPMPPRD